MSITVPVGLDGTPIIIAANGTSIQTDDGTWITKGTLGAMCNPNNAAFFQITAEIAGTTAVIKIDCDPTAEVSTFKAPVENGGEEEFVSIKSKKVEKTSAIKMDLGLPKGLDAE